MFLSSECNGCSYTHWTVGIGQGIGYTHPENHTTAQPRIPRVSDVLDCQLYKARESAAKRQKTRNEAW
jgi:hypothetical protein